MERSEQLPGQDTHAKKWRARVVLWAHARYGDKFCVISFPPLEYEYRNFLAVGEACKNEYPGPDALDWFNEVDKWARNRFGNSWFTSHSWEDVSNAYADELPRKEFLQ